MMLRPVTHGEWHLARPRTGAPAPRGHLFRQSRRQDRPCPAEL